jgi:hypothetical protein
MQYSNFILFWFFSLTFHYQLMEAEELEALSAAEKEDINASVCANDCIACSHINTFPTWQLLSCRIFTIFLR